VNKIGILAYGSLIEDPGCEIEPLVTKIHQNILTPFHIEFARSSKTRGGAPTVVPVTQLGSPVQASILALEENLTLEKATDLLWRRETRNETSNLHYQDHIKTTQIQIKTLKDFQGFESIIYASLPANISNPNPIKLAKLAVESVKTKAAQNAKDGISYLISLKNKGIKTPLMKEYEKQILILTNTDTLDNALKSVLKKK
jgi:cation transport regulator ChaC